MAPGNPPAAAPLPVEWDRLTALLKRGAALAFAVEKWFNSGIWVLCRSDAAYPGRLKKHLQKTAPPVLFGAGDVRLLSSGGLAIVGSPSTSPEALAFAAQISQRCAREGLTVVSGSTRGVDEAAILAALEAGGTAISVLADRLAATALSGKFRTPLRTGRLVLLSPHAPETGVSLENAPARNRLVYGLADFALVVSGALRPGSAWAGAEEELRRPSPIPVYVRLAADAPKGNHALLMLGARPFPEDLSSGPLAATLDQCHR
jgi:predicted Rossmann fold nucleotide-binding protein DprA/Smf involved in DNA uptake